jgi:hypothetical protein
MKRNNAIRYKMMAQKNTPIQKKESEELLSIRNYRAVYHRNETPHRLRKEH